MGVLENLGQASGNCMRSQYGLHQRQDFLFAVAVRVCTGQWVVYTKLRVFCSFLKLGCVAGRLRETDKVLPDARFELLHFLNKAQMKAVTLCAALRNMSLRLFQGRKPLPVGCKEFAHIYPSVPYRVPAVAHVTV
jgi:hypothetical protein